jgi:hypothetical protein
MKRRKILSDPFYTFSIITTTKITAHKCIWKVDVSMFIFLKHVTYIKKETNWFSL